MQHERRFYHHHWHYLGGTHVAANAGEIIMAYVACGEIVFDDLPEYPECENTYEANAAAAYERDTWDGLTTEDLLNLDLPF